MTVAPVCPALKSAAASPRATRSAATLIEALGFRRSAAAGASAMSTTALASTIRTCRGDSAALVPLQFGVQPLGGSHKGDAKLEVPRRREGTLDDVPRRLVASHARRRQSKSCWRFCRVQAAFRGSSGPLELFEPILPRPPSPVVRGNSRNSRTRGAAAWARGSEGIRRGPTGFSVSCVRRLAVRVFECRRLGFGISFSSFHLSVASRRRTSDPPTLACRCRSPD